MSWWTPFKTPAAEPSLPTLGFVDRYETFDLGEARANKVFYISGVGLTVTQNTGTATVRFNDPTSRQFTLTAGNSFPEVRFTRIYLTNATQTGATLTIFTRMPANTYYGPQQNKIVEAGVQRGLDDTVVNTAALIWTTLKTIYITNTSVNKPVSESSFEYRITAAVGTGSMRLRVDVDGGGWNTVHQELAFNNTAFQWSRQVWANIYFGNVVSVQLQALHSTGAAQAQNRGDRQYGDTTTEVYNF